MARECKRGEDDCPCQEVARLTFVAAEVVSQDGRRVPETHERHERRGCPYGRTIGICPSLRRHGTQCHELDELDEYKDILYHGLGGTLSCAAHSQRNHDGSKSVCGPSTHDRDADCAKRKCKQIGVQLDIVVRETADYRNKEPACESEVGNRARPQAH